VLEVLDAATGERVALDRRSVVLGAAGSDVGTLLALDTLARTAEVVGLRVSTVGVQGIPALNVRPPNASGRAEVTVLRPGGVPDPPYGLEHRLAWLSGEPVAAAAVELAGWRRLVAGWAEEASRPMSAEVQEDLLAALGDDLDTRAAVDALRGSLALDLPPGSLFETWVWADRVLALDLAADVGR
jgi:hypothetical protein